MIKNIVFDMGNVLIYFNKELFMNRFDITEADKVLIRRVVFDSLEWVCLDRGSLTEAEAVKIMNSRLPEHLHKYVPEFVYRWDLPELYEVPGMYELVEELHRNGYIIYLLSNASSRQHEYWPRIKASRFFSDTLISADYKLLKPEAEIYEMMYSKFNVDPSECFFIDDNPANVESSVRTGMRSCVFHNDVTELRSILISNGVNIQP